VSSVIGVVILFGFLILALSLYQVEVVPQQNAETEFQHSGEVRNDLVELRASILQAGSIDQPQYQTVQLGTAYSPRTFSINPPSPAGTIRTTDPYPITISNNSGTPEGTITIPTRFIEYQPGYNELDRSPTWYDASVLYLDARDEGGGIAVIEDQTLVDGGEVQITALQNEFRKSGTGQVTLELRPTKSVTGNIPEGDINITFPTRLSNGEYWNGTDIPSNEYSITNDTNGDGVYNLTLETTSGNLTVDTVGVQEAPEDPTQNDAVRVGSEPIETESSVKGTVFEDDGSTTVSDGTVKLYEGQTDTSGTTTNTVDLSATGGTYSFDDVAAGDVTIGVTGVTGFKNDSRTITLTAGEDTTENFQLTAGSDNADQLTVTSIQENNGDIIIQFRNNNAQSVTFDEVRLDNYNEANPPSGPGNNPDPIDRVRYRPGSDDLLLQEGNGFGDVTGPTLSNNGNEDIRFAPKRLNQGGQTKEASAESGDKITITVMLSDGSTKQFTETVP